MLERAGRVRVADADGTLHPTPFLDVSDNTSTSTEEGLLGLAFDPAFVDNGYMDMWKIMKTLREVDFRGILIADHVPEMVGGRRVGWGYSIGYIKALLARANAEAAG